MERALNVEEEHTTRAVTFFDIDNTLVREFTVFNFVDFLVAEGLFDSRAQNRVERDLAYYTLHKDYRRFAVDVVKHYCSGLKDQMETEVEQAGRDFLEIYKALLFPFASDLVQLMNREGKTVAISGAPREAFIPLKEFLKISDAHLLEAEIVGDHYTGRPKVNMALDEEKRAVVQTIKGAVYNPAVSFAFGDSNHDLPILEAVSNPFAVNPNRELRRIALDRNWPIVNETNILEMVRERIADLKSPD